MQTNPKLSDGNNNNNDNNQMEWTWRAGFTDENGGDTWARRGDAKLAKSSRLPSLIANNSTRLSGSKQKATVKLSQAGAER